MAAARMSSLMMWGTCNSCGCTAVILLHSISSRQYLRPNIWPGLLTFAGAPSAPHHGQLRSAACRCNGYLLVAAHGRALVLTLCARGAPTRPVHTSRHRDPASSRRRVRPAAAARPPPVCSAAREAGRDTGAGSGTPQA
jgi:hypothetical protein